MKNCYQLMVRMIHNGKIRKEASDFLAQAAGHERQLKDLLQNARFSSVNFENLPLEDDYDWFELEKLSLIGVIDLALETGQKKLKLYRYLQTNKDMPSLGFSRTLMYATVKELRFLRNEKKFQENPYENIRVESLLYLIK